MSDQFRLTPDEQKLLRDQDTTVQAIANTIDRMERIGLDVAEQRDRLNRAQQIREGMLREFGNPVVPR